MPQIKTVDLDSKVMDIGPIHFLRAEWRDAASRAVLVRYSIAGAEQPFGFCLDLDKKVLLEWTDAALESRTTEAEWKARAEAIWNIVAPVRAKDRAFSP
jgi:hypothetical protein